MKNRHIIAAALLLLTTTTAAQDRHTETTPDTGENLQTTPNAEQLRQQIETLQRQLDLLEKGRDTLAVKKPALLSDPVEPIANMNGIIPLDTLQTINEAVKIVIYNDNSWKYVRDREFVKDSSIYTKYWDTSTLFPYKEYPLSEMPASLAIDLVDSLKCYHYPYKGSIRSKYGIRYRRRHQGVDIPVKTGDPIYATFDGRVRISEYNRGGYGNLIIVRHDNGLETYYGHLSERLVQSGEWVEAGQIIGLGGSIRPVSKRVTCVEIQSVADLQEAVTELTEKYVIHGVVHSMAVSDYKVRSVSTIDSLSEYLENRSAETGDLQKKIVQGMDETDLREGVGKLSSQMGAPLLLLEPTPKILPMFREMAPQAVIIGFKLLSQVSVEELFDTAHRLLVKNRCDFVLANDMTEIDENHHRGYLIDPERNIQTFDTKQEIAKGIVQTIYSEVEHR